MVGERGGEELHFIFFVLYNLFIFILFFLFFLVKKLLSSLWVNSEKLTDSHGRAILAYVRIGR